MLLMYKQLKFNKIYFCINNNINNKCNNLHFKCCIFVRTETSNTKSHAQQPFFNNLKNDVNKILTAVQMMANSKEDSKSLLTSQ